MKRTTIMVEESILYDLKQIAKQQNRSTSNVIREALAVYITEQHATAPPDNPLLGLVGIGESDEPTDIANGVDEQILREEIQPVYGWSTRRD